VAQCVECHLKHADVSREVAPCLAACDWREWSVFDISEQQGILRQFAKAQFYAEFEPGFPMIAQCIGQYIGEGDVSTPRLGS